MSWDGIEKVDFLANDILFHEGDIGFYFYIIQEGEIEVFRKTAKGDKKILDTIGAGQALGEFALVTQQPRSASARALTAGSAYKVSEENYKKLLSELPGWANAILEGLIVRLRKTSELLAEQSV
jgi:CRP/FNR family cyclic AMP-dependent transcriptional regulator